MPAFLFEASTFMMTLNIEGGPAGQAPVNLKICLNNIDRAWPPTFPKTSVDERSQTCWVSVARGWPHKTRTHDIQSHKTFAQDLTQDTVAQDYFAPGETQ